MSCRELDRAWDRRLDSVRAGSPVPEVEGFPPELEAHLARCPRCRSRSAGYAALAQAIAALEPSLVPAASLPGRILSEVHRDPEPSRLVLRGRLPILRSAAVAAVVLLGVLAGLWALRPEGKRGETAIVQDAPSLPEAPRPLTEAVAEAAEATVALALKTSEPATRIGRDVFGSATSSEVPPDDPVVPPNPIVPGSAADRVVKLIGDGLEAGVRPLSRPTRSAFGFLLPNLPRADEPPPDDRGA
ncbi:hypothetical protein [Tautonia sociabilis]|uniref:Zinc-finger domain-containing protein n=1 Tax=Tautonia sociabilis TaxID=2080755 RepID=A0A432MGP5_9BACT|nr:hypothetical protein [Tautonia sociabilis]RUL86089.1 hypothetical protein TsocGM_16865 [Tautonia sociabilis]